MRHISAPRQLGAKGLSPVAVAGVAVPRPHRLGKRVRSGLSVAEFGRAGGSAGGRLKAWRLPSTEPTYAPPLATAGEEATELPVAALQSGSPVAASKAWSLSSSDPT